MSGKVTSRQTSRSPATVYSTRRRMQRNEVVEKANAYAQRKTMKLIKQKTINYYFNKLLGFTCILRC